jgi:hypothetical protein
MRERSRVAVVGAGASTLHPTFNGFMEKVVLPARALNPAHRRLDGEQTGGNWDVTGVFKHHGRQWKVHADTHYEPMLVAYGACKAGLDPFVEEPIKNGMSLNLTDDLRQKLSTPRFKYIYIYEA